MADLPILAALSLSLYVCVCVCVCGVWVGGCGCVCMINCYFNIAGEVFNAWEVATRNDSRRR